MIALSFDSGGTSAPVYSGMMGDTGWVNREPAIARALMQSMSTQQSSASIVNLQYDVGRRDMARAERSE